MFAEKVYFNSAYRSALRGNSVVRWLVKNGAKIKKTGSRNVGKENGGCFSCSYRVGRAGKLLVFFYFVKGIWLII